jgi:hypothetical protein
VLGLAAQADTAVVAEIQARQAGGVADAQIVFPTLMRRTFPPAIAGIANNPTKVTAQTNTATRKNAVLAKIMNGLSRHTVYACRNATFRTSSAEPLTLVRLPFYAAC